ncbi:MAG: hypothetical protein JXA66_07855 [Oligoflexia bacterium]|nr:hypothetical protein [Oligoflexia bacterium]
MKYLMVFFISLCLGAGTLDAQQKRTVRKKSSSKTVMEKKASKKQFIDLEGLDIQGLIDRPQTLYILKKSKVDFYDVIDDYDYVKAIMDTTYNAPF